MKFTGGKWVVKCYSGLMGVYSLNNDVQSAKEDMANKDLIEAAPDMLAVCQEVIKWASKGQNHGGNPYCKDFVIAAAKVVDDLKEKGVL